MYTHTPAPQMCYLWQSSFHTQKHVYIKRRTMCMWGRVSVYEFDDPYLH